MGSEKQASDFPEKRAIVEELEEQSKIIESINISLEQLENRLAPIRSARPEVSGSASKNPEGYNSQVYNIIIEQNRSLIKIKDQVNYLIADVDL